ncbi:hypothetical protein F5Y17DRAFT_463256 [Xylariaceae sp. FL0594]|nr:hypothetical protein F5Y17DRAFT_463256 [Xylariaceae sp. FL0594]
MSSEEAGAGLRAPNVKGRRSETDRAEAKKKKEKRAKTLENIKKHHARHREGPSHSAESKFVIEMTQFPLKRPAHPAYDDTSTKRRKVSAQAPKRPKPPRGQDRNWGGGLQFEQPLTDADIPIGSSLLDPQHGLGQNTMTAQARLAELPAEVMDCIFRYLLVWHEDIPVFDGWSCVYPRRRPQLPVQILRACRVLHERGVRILYGDNVFAYDLRDPPGNSKDREIVMKKVYGRCMVPINKYGHLIRHIKVEVRDNHMDTREQRQSFEAAVTKFVYKKGKKNGLLYPANLHSVTMTIPAMCASDLGLSIPGTKPDYVPICDHLRTSSEVFKALLSFRIKWLHILAKVKNGDIWSDVHDLRAFSNDEAMKQEYEDNIKTNKRKETAHGVGEQASGLVKRHPHRPRDIGVVGNYRDLQIRQAKGKLRNLAWRVEMLALDPDRAVNELRLWRPVPVARKGRGSSNSDGELIALPSDWVEPSFSRSSAPSGPRTRATHGKARQTTKVDGPTKLQSDAMNGRTATCRTPASPTILSSNRDRRQEASLLQAQQCAPTDVHDN